MADNDLTWDDIAQQLKQQSDATAPDIAGANAAAPAASSSIDPSIDQFAPNVSSELPPDQMQKLLAMRDQLPVDAAAKDATASMSPDDLEAARQASIEPTATMTPEELIAAKEAGKKAAPGIWESILNKVKGVAPQAAEDVAEGGLALSPLGIAASVATPTTANAGEDSDVTALRAKAGAIPLPNGGMSDAQAETKAGAGPVATTGSNPNNPGPSNGIDLGALLNQSKSQFPAPSSATQADLASPAAVAAKMAPRSAPAAASAPAATPPATPQAPAQAEPSMMDLLKQAQAHADSVGNSNAIVKAGMMAGQALAQAHSTVPIGLNTSAIDQLTKQAQEGPGQVIQQAGLKSALQNQQMTGLKIQQEQAAVDPNSQQSKLYTGVAKQFAQNLGLDSKMFDGLSAQGTEKMLPLLERYQQHVEANATNLQKTQDRQVIQQQLQDQKASQAQDKTLQQTKQLLTSARGDPAVGQAEKDIYSAAKANSLANLYGDPNKLTPQMASLLASEVGKIASGGVSNMEQLRDLNIHTIPSGFASIVQKFTNQPTPANAGAFVKQYQDYANALTTDAQKVIQDKYGRVIESSKKQLGPDNYQALKTEFLGRFDDANKAAAAIKQHSDQVAAFAKAHNMSEARAEALMRSRMNAPQAPAATMPPQTGGQ